MRESDLLVELVPVGSWGGPTRIPPITAPEHVLVAPYGVGRVGGRSEGVVGKNGTPHPGRPATVQLPSERCRREIAAFCLHKLLVTPQDQLGPTGPTEPATEKPIWFRTDTGDGVGRSRGPTLIGRGA
jgi:hypothetical protein